MHWATAIRSISMKRLRVARESLSPSSSRRNTHSIDDNRPLSCRALTESGSFLPHLLGIAAVPPRGRGGRRGFHATPPARAVPASLGRRVRAPSSSAGSSPRCRLRLGHAQLVLGKGGPGRTLPGRRPGVRALSSAMPASISSKSWISSTTMARPRLRLFCRRPRMRSRWPGPQPARSGPASTRRPTHSKRP